jgi:predicted TIM-barrel fold metal-dependent hydrolase
MSIFSEPKIDCHAHALDPVRFPYGSDAAYKPSGQEVGTPAQLQQVMQTYGVGHVLLVQPNSGYGSDNSCLLDTIAHGGDRFKGIAIIDFDASIDDLRALKARGVLGAAFNPTFHGNDYYKGAAPLIEKLAQADMILNLQVEREQLLRYVPWIESIPVRVLIDHCGRPTVRDGLKAPPFQALLKLARTGRVGVKLSGYSKFSEQAYPFEDCWPFVYALADAFTLDHCLWASDWPYLRAQQRQDYGPLVELVGRLFPDPVDRHMLLWTTPRRMFGFGEEGAG